MAKKTTTKATKKAAAKTPQEARQPKAAIVKAAALKERGGRHFNGFMEFVRTQGVVGLAVGLVLGGAVTVVVKSLIDNVVMPPLGFILGSAEGLKGLTLNLGQTASGKDAILHYGTFINDIINFVVIAVIIYLVVHILGFDKLDKKKE